MSSLAHQKAGSLRQALVNASRALNVQPHGLDNRVNLVQVAIPAMVSTVISTQFIGLQLCSHSCRHYAP